MERVKKGEKYWYIESEFFAGDFYITYGVDFYEDIQDGRFALGNYFHTKEEARVMRDKLRAVFKGADVIEIPSEEEISQQATAIAWNRQDDYYDDEGNVIRCYGECYDSAKDMYRFMKSKIVK